MKIILLLVIIGVIMRLLGHFFLTIFSLPGRLIAFPDDRTKHTKLKLFIGTAVSIFGQLCFYLTYTTLIVRWAKPNELYSLVSLLLIIIAIYPIWSFRNFMKKTLDEQKNLAKDMESDWGKSEVIYNMSIFKAASLASFISVIVTVAWLMYLLLT